MLSYLFPQEKNERITSISSDNYELILKKPEESVKIIQDLFSENPGKTFVFNADQSILIIKWHPIDYNKYNGEGFFSLTIKSNRKELNGWTLESYISRHDREGIKFSMTNGELYKIKLNKNLIEVYSQCTRGGNPVENWKWV